MSIICVVWTLIPFIYFFLFQSGKKLAVMNIGAPACGANAAVRSFVRFALTKGYTVLGIHDSFDGLLYGDVSIQEVLRREITFLTNC